MPRWLWFSPLAVLVTALTAWGFRWGWIAATITETDVINTFAQRYVAGAGAAARLTDCTAVPGAQKGVWIVVRCGRQDTRYDYPVDRFGRLLTLPDVTHQPVAPKA